MSEKTRKVVFSFDNRNITAYELTDKMIKQQRFNSLDRLGNCRCCFNTIDEHQSYKEIEIENPETKQKRILIIPVSQNEL